MRRVFGEEHEETLLVTNDHGADMRIRGEFAAVLELDTNTMELHEQVFGEDHLQDLMVVNNFAEDQELNSGCRAAQRTHQDRLDFFGRDDHPWVISSLATRGGPVQVAVAAGQVAPGAPLQDELTARLADQRSAVFHPSRSSCWQLAIGAEPEANVLCLIHQLSGSSFQARRPAPRVAMWRTRRRRLVRTAGSSAMTRTLSNRASTGSTKGW